MDSLLKDILCAGGLLILAGNLWNYDRRCKMTKEERKAEDDEIDDDPHSRW